MVLIFVGGMFSSNTKIEKIADYATNVVLNQTSNKPLCAITIGKTDDSGSMPDADSEFHNTYGTFMQYRIAFASAVNPDKDLSINFDSFEAGNLSMLYGGAVGTIPYDDHFKHNTLPIEMMFNDEKMYDISNYVVYISQNQADKILDSYNLPRQANGLHSEAEYGSLLKQLVPISINGTITDFVIQNIYFQFNYYYDSLSEVMGDFVIFSYYLPDNLRAQQRNMYFMDEYVYHNKYFMNYIVNAYPSRTFSLKINHYNITSEIDEDLFLSFYYQSNIKSSDWINTFLVVIAVLLLVLSLVLTYVGSDNKKSIIFCLLQLGVLFIPYIFFSLLYRLTSNIYFLSETASKTNMFIILIYGFIYMMLHMYGSYIFHRKSSYEKDCYEIDI